jgi:hypothetical protein
MANRRKLTPEEKRLEKAVGKIVNSEEFNAKVQAANARDDEGFRWARAKSRGGPNALV